MEREENLIQLNEKNQMLHEKVAKLSSKVESLKELYIKQDQRPIAAHSLR